jgi:hypothetical protein
VLKQTIVSLKTKHLNNETGGINDTVVETDLTDAAKTSPTVVAAQTRLAKAWSRLAIPGIENKDGWERCQPSWRIPVTVQDSTMMYWARPLAVNRSNTSLFCETFYDQDIPLHGAHQLFRCSLYTQSNTLSLRLCRFVHSPETVTTLAAQYSERDIFTPIHHQIQSPRECLNEDEWFMEMPPFHTIVSLL